MRKLKTTWNELFKMWILPSSWLNPVCRNCEIGRVFSYADTKKQPNSEMAIFHNIMMAKTDFLKTKIPVK
jgi:hypothetical protein